MSNTNGISRGIRFGARQLIVSRWDDDEMTIVYLCRGEKGDWTADLEDERIWKFTDDLEAQLMLGYAAGYDETAAVVTFES